jgi:hypothetical protein
MELECERYPVNSDNNLKIFHCVDRKVAKVEYMMRLDGHLPVNEARMTINEITLPILHLDYHSLQPSLRYPSHIHHRPIQF